MIKNNKVFISYFFICALCFLLDTFSLLSLVYLFHLDYKLSEIIGLFIGNTCNYFLSTKFAFKNPKYHNKIKEYFYYLFLAFCSYPVHHLILVLSTNYFGLKFLAFNKLLAVTASFMITYLLRKKILFQNG
ncbi:MAG: hypothetical protein COB02_05810 [Candidatus Cloacimonadota bacterium]|nr:MAG: hypothetical protein COB02_05810 [Candidatus Cloacimonadota bacterium]